MVGFWKPMFELRLTAYAAVMNYTEMESKVDRSLGRPTEPVLITAGPRSNKQ